MRLITIALLEIEDVKVESHNIPSGKLKSTDLTIDTIPKCDAVFTGCFDRSRTNEDIVRFLEGDLKKKGYFGRLTNLEKI